MYDSALDHNISEYKTEILNALKRYKQRVSVKPFRFIYPESEEVFVEHCLKCDFCRVYDNYLVVASVGAQWWDSSTPVLFEALVLSIGEHKKSASFIDALDHYRKISGCKYISFGTQSLEAKALGKVLLEHGYIPYGSFYCKEG